MVQKEWQAKGVKPLLYLENKRHTRLHSALSKWAQLHKGGFTARRSLALANADRPPPDPHDMTARQVVWALSDPSGDVAEAFAKHELAPPIGWLPVLDAQGLLQLSAQDRSGNASGEVRTVVTKLCGHPSITAAPPDLSRVSRWMAHWISRHLDKPEVLKWALNGEGWVLHPTMRFAINQTLNKKPSLPANIKVLWRLLASDSYADLVAARQRSCFQATGELGQESPFACREILRLFTPLPVLKYTDIYANLDDEVISTAEDIYDQRVHRYIHVDVALIDEHLTQVLVPRMVRREKPFDKDAVLADLADDATSLLKQAMDWWALFGKAKPDFDTSCRWLPSIAPHAQNSDFREWTRLIEFAREAYLALSRIRPERAATLVARWRTLDFPVFRRLILFAAAADERAVNEGYSLLLDRSRNTLWDDNTTREVCDHQDVAAELPQRLADRPGELAVGDQRLRLAVLQAVGQRACIEPGIQGVEDGAGHRHAEMRLVHLRRVGGHHRHGVAATDAGANQCRGELAAAGVGFVPGIAARTVYHRRPLRTDQRRTGDESQRRQRLMVGGRLVEIHLERARRHQHGGIGRHLRGASLCAALP
jgi:hypothetical protein